MIRITDTQKTENPNIFGEILREYAFKEEYGCYSCFDLVNEFKEVEARKEQFELIMQREFDPTPIPDSAADWGCEDDEEYLKRINWFVSKTQDIEIGWYWDGDGTLYIREGEKSAINSDCKKDYKWKWCK